MIGVFEVRHIYLRLEIRSFKVHAFSYVYKSIPPSTKKENLKALRRLGAVTLAVPKVRQHQARTPRNQADVVAVPAATFVVLLRERIDLLLPLRHAEKLSACKGQQIADEVPLLVKFRLRGTS